MSEFNYSGTFSTMSYSIVRWRVIGPLHSGATFFSLDLESRFRLYPGIGKVLALCPNVESFSIPPRFRFKSYVALPSCWYLHEVPRSILVPSRRFLLITLGNYSTVAPTTGTTSW